VKRTVRIAALVSVAVLAPALFSLPARDAEAHGFRAQDQSLFVSVSGSGHVSGPGIDCPKQCSQTYKDGTVLTLQASSDSGWQLAGWKGDCVGTGDCKLTMDAGHKVEADFVQQQSPPPSALAVTPGAVKAVEGGSFKGQLATFVDRATGKGACADAGSYSSQVDWGDGSQGSATVELTGGPDKDNNCSYALAGSHAYAEELTGTAAVTVKSATGTASARVTVTVDDAPLTARSETSAASTWAGRPGVAAPVGTFSDADPAGAAGDYTARIDWGDGQTGAGEVQAAGGSFRVLGAHTYAKPGIYTVRTTIGDHGASVDAGATALVRARPARHAATLRPRTAPPRATSGLHPGTRIPFTGKSLELPIHCPAQTRKRCRGTLTVTTAGGGKPLVLARGRFDLAPTQITLRPFAVNSAVAQRAHLETNGTHLTAGYVLRSRGAASAAVKVVIDARQFEPGCPSVPDPARKSGQLRMWFYGTGLLTSNTVALQEETAALAPDGSIWGIVAGLGIGGGQSTLIYRFSLTPIGARWDLYGPAYGIATSPDSLFGSNAMTQLVVAPDGDAVFIAQRGPFANGGLPALGRMTPAGQVAYYLLPGDSDSAAVETSAPTSGLTVGPDGAIWLSEWSRIDRFDPGDGRFSTFTAPGLLDPGSLTVGSDRNIWFEERDGFGRITPAGEITQFPAAHTLGGVWYGLDSGYNIPDGSRRMTATPGTLWGLASSGGGPLFESLDRISTSGHVFAPIPRVWPGALATGPDGNVWIAAPSLAGSLQRVSADGSRVDLIHVPRGEIHEIPDGLVPGDLLGTAVAGHDGRLYVTAVAGLRGIPGMLVIAPDTRGNPHPSCPPQG
jgi:Divergent InlB B-repeat domain